MIGQMHDGRTEGQKVYEVISWTVMYLVKEQLLALLFNTVGYNSHIMLFHIQKPLTLTHPHPCTNRHICTMAISIFLFQYKKKQRASV